MPGESPTALQSHQDEANNGSWFGIVSPVLTRWSRATATSHPNTCQLPPMPWPSARTTAPKFEQLPPMLFAPEYHWL